MENKIIELYWYGTTEFPIIIAQLSKLIQQQIWDRLCIYSVFNIPCKIFANWWVKYYRALKNLCLCWCSVDFYIYFIVNLNFKEDFNVDVYDLIHWSPYWCIFDLKVDLLDVVVEVVDQRAVENILNQKTSANPVQG